ncbi:MBL fold metallo-hydrolase [Jiella avicenniae]|uniref:MBL fold metallo-hydrolase n=1 Tax=Jiella avicenniae TaxID=2907202 RepID=A0A9X1P2Y5_9HYPH|nr:MBL fold metallo-hydrolase [Jiella avicenniae]MCE7030412.1 MBL fold metallo-hydrolase [Jiella avicenniae]
MAKNPYHSGPVTDHFDGTRFHNLGQRAPDRSFRDLLKWQFAGERAKWPDHVPVEPAIPEPRVDGLRVTMVGHASVLIQVAGLAVLTDPVWSERVSPFTFAGPKRVAEPGIRFEDLPPIDLVLLSHNHYDHCDVATLRRLHEHHRPQVVTALGNDVLLKRAIADIDVVAGDWGDEIAVGERPGVGEGNGRAGGGPASVAIVPANHWSRRGFGDTRQCLWCGFVLKAGGWTVYFAGDSGYGGGEIFRAIGERYGAPDLALIPIGAYAPRWFMEPQHMNPEEAVRTFADVGARQAVAIHWGTVQLTDEPFDEPAHLLGRSLSEAGISSERFRPLAPGESLHVRRP